MQGSIRRAYKNMMVVVVNGRTYFGLFGAQSSGVAGLLRPHELQVVDTRAICKTDMGFDLNIGIMP